MPTPDPIPTTTLVNILDALELSITNTHLSATMNPRAPYLAGARDTLAAIRLALGLPTPDTYHPFVVTYSEPITGSHTNTPQP